MPILIPPAVKQPLCLLLSLYTVGCSKSIVSQNSTWELLTYKLESRLLWMPTRMVLSVGIWWTRHPPFLSLTSSSFRWSNTSCSFILPQLPILSLLSGVFFSALNVFVCLVYLTKFCLSSKTLPHTTSICTISIPLTLQCKWAVYIIMAHLDTFHHPSL